MTSNENALGRSARLIATVGAAALCWNLARAQPTSGFGRPADRLVPRTDRNSQIAYELTFIVLPHLQKCGGIEITPLGFFLGITGVTISIVAFCWCPRRCIVAKSLTPLGLLPVLDFAVKIGFVILGRWFDPSFGHC